jgi:hypothetical protein
MFDPDLAIVTAFDLSIATASIAWIGISIWRGRTYLWLRRDQSSPGQFKIINRRSDPFNSCLALLIPLRCVVLSSMWAPPLLNGLIAGKQLRSRLRDGTAAFDNEGIACPGDTTGYTHFHTCEGPPVRVPE